MMHYEKPELIVVDSALALVLGEFPGAVDGAILDEHVQQDLALGLDE